MSNRKHNKERERHCVEVFKSVYKEFPVGEILADENQERPDIIVKSALTKVGIEVTSIQDRKLKRAESEREKAVSEACQIYEASNLPPLHVGVHIGCETTLNKKTRHTFAKALAKLIIANVPPINGSVELENNWTNTKNFPYEINFISIFRYASLTRNFWSTPSAGFFRTDFIGELQQIITDKNEKRLGYAPDCNAQWLLIVVESGGPSTFFEASPATLNHHYDSSFDKVFLLELFHRKILDLKLSALR